MSQFSDDAVNLEEIESDEEFALHLADTMKRGCEQAGLTVSILPSTGGYSMSIMSLDNDVACEVFINPTGFINTLQ
jgi:hypothetical protein